MLFTTKSASWVAVMSLALLAGACATNANKGDTGVDRAVSKTQNGFSDAALTPLSDVNLRRVPIPAKLEALGSPYAPVTNMGCPAIAREVDELTIILGPDFDSFLPGETTDQKIGDAAGGLALNTVSGAVTDFIPYRSIVRAASGASEHERRLKAAYERGAHRRTYLKGLGAALGCGPPAAPDPRALMPPAKPTIEYREARPKP
jgi:hypothetical protein